MAIKCHRFILMFFVLAFDVLAEENRSSIWITRSQFPPDFIFGTASASYQYEGAAREGGRGPSVWDTFSEKTPERIRDQSNGAVADDFYHRYKEDVKMMNSIGFGAFRFSISWSRILPRGSVKGGINQEGISFYNSLIDELISNGIIPFVTLWHWDTPQALEDAYGGFLGDSIVNDFQDYVEICFREFGDRVKHWMTLNEPLSVARSGYAKGTNAPGRCSKFINANCTIGDSATEPYIAGHNMLLAHAAAVKIYRDKYQASQKGEIGLVVNSAWMLPLSNSDADRQAAARTMAFTFDWFLEPLVTGSYPADMINYLKQRLPKFSENQSSMLKGSYDFVGINYYSTNYAMDRRCATENISYITDSCAITTTKRNGVPIGPTVSSLNLELFLLCKVRDHFMAFQAGSDWLQSYPSGIRDLVLYTKYKFKDPIIYITENGWDEVSKEKMSLNDVERIDYHARHLAMLKDAISVGANVRGYFAWSLLDNYEWAYGYTVRFGLVYVDYKDKQKRYPKESAKWFSKFLSGNRVEANN